MQYTKKFEKEWKNNIKVKEADYYKEDLNASMERVRKNNSSGLDNLLVAISKVLKTPVCKHLK